VCYWEYNQKQITFIDHGFMVWFSGNVDLVRPVIWFVILIPSRLASKHTLAPFLSSSVLTATLSWICQLIVCGVITICWHRDPCMFLLFHGIGRLCKPIFNFVLYWRSCCLIQINFFGVLGTWFL
jgi:hypothetical protein